MIATLTLISTLIVTILITRIGTIALKLTGLPEDVAAFQSRSAFSGTGFTTKESEMITRDPARRQIVMFLMVAGNIGIAAVVATSIASFNTAAAVGQQQWWIQLTSRLLLLVGGAILILALTRSKLLSSVITKLIEAGLRRWTKINVVDYESLLNLTDGYVVGNFEIENDSWLESRSLTESALSLEGILVLGVHREKGSFFGSPIGSTRLYEKDTIVIYGRGQRILELRDRKKGADGDKAHRIATKIQQELSTEMVSKDSV